MPRQSKEYILLVWLAKSGVIKKSLSTSARCFILSACFIFLLASPLRCDSIKEMKKTFIQLSFTLAAASVLSLSSCKPPNAATEQAAQELNEMRGKDIPELFVDDELGASPEQALMLATLDQFCETEDVNTANEQGLSILHLACFFQKQELVRCLLEDGADPNHCSAPSEASRMKEGDNALNYVFYGIRDDNTAQDIIPLVELLLQHGATLNKDSSKNYRPLELAGSAGHMEELFLYILKLTAEPAKDPVTQQGYSISCMAWPAYHHWAQSLQQLLELGADASACTGANQTPLLSLVFHEHGTWGEEGKKSAQLLIDHGADINKCDIDGHNAIFEVCKILVEQRQDDFDEIGLAEKIAFMLDKGADPYQRADGDLVYPGFCAFDFMMMRPNIISKLKELGHDLKVPELYIPDDELALLATLCRAAQTDIPAQEFAPHFKRLQDVLQPKPEVAQHELYPTAVEVALKYLIALDEDAANAFVSSLPSWYAERDWSKLDAQITPLLLALQDIQEYRIESKILLHVAQELDKAGQEASAIEVLQMLHRCEDCDAVTAPMRTDARRAMRTGALFADLLRANLPLPKDGMVEAWLTQREQEADSDVLKKAQLLTSQSHLWFGAMPDEQRDELLQAMVDIGVPEAAEQYKHIIANLQNPKELDRIMNGDMNWYMELESAIAAYIWQIREEFFTKAKAAPQTPEAHRPLHVHSDDCGHCCH